MELNAEEQHRIRRALHALLLDTLEHAELVRQLCDVLKRDIEGLESLLDRFGPASNA